MVCEHIHPDQEEDLPEIDEPAYELDDDTDDHAEYDFYSDEYIEDEDEDDSIIYKEHLVEYLPWRKVDLEHFLQQCLERTYDDEDLSAGRGRNLPKFASL